MVAPSTHAALIALLLVLLIDHITYAADSCESRRFRLLSQICTSEDASNSAVDNIKYFVETDMSKARRIAYECLALIRTNERYESKLSVISSH